MKQACYSESEIAKKWRGKTAGWTSYMPRGILNLVLYCGLLFGLATQNACETEKPDPLLIDWRHATVSEARSAVADPRTPDDMVLVLLGNMGPIDETPAFWKAIADNPKCSDLHRRRAVLQLFYRYVHTGMTLRDLAELVKGSSWLKDSDVGSVYTRGNVFAVNLLPTRDPTGGYCIFFGVQEGISRDTIARALCLGPDQLGATAGQTRLLEIRYSDGYHGEREDSP
jgi:hypothetical protein